MILIRDIQTSRIDLPRVVLTIGSFDGVHCGHRFILNQVVQDASRKRGTPCVLTFDPHPREFFSPEHPPNLLTCNETKFSLLAQMGITVIALLPFNAETAAMSVEQFVKQIIVEQCRASEVIVGHDFRFGKNGEGNFESLKELSKQYAFEVKQVAPILIHGERVSSTVIRERVLQGDLDEAEVFLGRKFSIVGEVVRGKGIGRELGFPTANVKPYHNAIPPQGVYAAQVLLDTERFQAAVNIGIAPTLSNQEQTIEAFLLDFSQDIVGKTIEIIFHRRLRSEQKFPSREALITQITRDVESVRHFFSGKSMQ